eukprot:scaffold73265_cov69-Phaeocystis_antarctica.AAC.1
MAVAGTSGGSCPLCLLKGCFAGWPALDLRRTHEGTVWRGGPASSSEEESLATGWFTNWSKHLRVPPGSFVNRRAAMERRAE